MLKDRDQLVTDLAKAKLDKASYLELRKAYFANMVDRYQHLPFNELQRLSELHNVSCELED